MSYQAVEFVRAQNIPSTAQKLVLVMIAHRVNSDSGKWAMKQDVIAEDCTMCARSVRQHIISLEESGRITRTERRGRTGSRIDTEYELVGYAEWNAYHRKAGEPTAREFWERCMNSPQQPMIDDQCGDDDEAYRQKPSARDDTNLPVGNTKTCRYIKEGIPSNPNNRKAGALVVNGGDGKPTSTSEGETHNPEENL